MDSARIVDGYRRDLRGRLALAVFPAFAIAALGAVLAFFGARSVLARDPSRAYAGRPTAASVRPQVLPPQAPEREPFLLYAGAALCMLSPLVMGFSLHRVADERDFLLLRHDGLVHERGGRALLYRWDEVDSVRHDASTGALVLVVRDEGEVRISERYAGTSPEALALRVAEVRRKALFQLLPSQRHPS